MNKKKVESLFLKAFNEVREKSSFPFNVSKVNDEMRRMNSKYNISNTPYSRFGD
jgi:hypothetical protein